MRILYMLLCLPLIHTAAYALDESDLKTEVVNVTRIGDGDTIYVRRSDGSYEWVRFLAIQAMEEYDSGDEIPDCNATNATDRLAEILCSGDADCPSEPEITLKVWDESLTSGGRLLRYIFIDDGKGGEINVNLTLVEEGYVLAWPQPNETLYNDEVWLAQMTAMKNQTGPLWNSSESQCHNADHENIDLEMWVNWDAAGVDSTNLNGEWFKIHNTGNTSVDLSYWWLRDIGGGGILHFPNGTTIAPDEIITVYVGEGTDSGNTFYLNLTSSIFSNGEPDGAYLLDYYGSNTSKSGEIIVSFTYPCVLDCSDPLQSRISITANYDAEGNDSENPNGEWVDIRNNSSQSADLLKYRLSSDPTGSAIYNFDQNSVIYAGETMRVHVGKGTDSRLVKYWGNSTGILANDEDRVLLDSYDAIVIDEDYWPVPVYTPNPGSVIMAPVYNLLFK